MALTCVQFSPRCHPLLLRCKLLREEIASEIPNLQSIFPFVLLASGLLGYFLIGSDAPFTLDHPPSHLYSVLCFPPVGLLSSTAVPVAPCSGSSGSGPWPHDLVSPDIELRNNKSVTRSTGLPDV